MKHKIYKVWDKTTKSALGFILAVVILKLCAIVLGL